MLKHEHSEKECLVKYTTSASGSTLTLPNQYFGQLFLGTIISSHSSIHPTNIPRAFTSAIPKVRQRWKETVIVLRYISLSKCGMQLLGAALADIYSTLILY